ncbi:hypothetical protein CR513_44735, partial [Mucuna pruriens]
MEEELKSIEKNKKWKLALLPLQKKPIHVKWIYKIKVNIDGSMSRYKVKLVAKGFMQKARLDYLEVFSPLNKNWGVKESIRLVVAIISYNQLDVKTTFLNGALEEKVYVLQLPGFEMQNQEKKVYILRKTLYGLKQAHQTWNKRIESFLFENVFKKCINEYGIYVKEVRDTTTSMVQYANCNLAKTLAGCEIHLVKDVVNPILFKQIVGCLRYFCNSKLDILYVMSLVSRFMENPKVSHMAATKRILSYSLITKTKPKENITGITNSDWCGDKEDKKNKSGYVFKLSNIAFSWSSIKQSVLTLSSCEAKYIVASTRHTCQTGRLQTILEHVHLKTKKKKNQ